MQGDFAVWQDYRGLGAGDIYVRDLANGQVRSLGALEGGQYHPRIAGPWILWADNRDLQLDLYGYHLEQGVVIQLTDTHEDEDYPQLRDNWVTYVQESLTVPGQHEVKLSNLSSRSSLFLTNSATTKLLACSASSQAIWVEDNGSQSQIWSARLPDLQAVTPDRNLVAITGGFSQYADSAFQLLEQWHDDSGVTQLVYYSSLVPTPTPQTALWSNGQPAGDNFVLVPGSFIWAGFSDAHVVDLGWIDCQPLHLAAGVNVLSYSCFPDQYSPRKLINGLGVERVNSLRLLDSSTGRWISVDVVNGRIRGPDVRIPNVAVVMLDMKEEFSQWTP